MANHIERRRNLWYATLHIPTKLRPRLGRMKFIQSLGTPDKRKAEYLAAPIIAGWKAQIRQAAGEPDGLHQEAMRWRHALTGLPEGSEERGTLESVLTDHAEALEADGIPEAEAVRFARVALGTELPTQPLYVEWSAALDSSGLEQKNIDRMRKDVALMTGKFTTLQQITTKSVKAWVKELAAAGVTASSRKRILGACRRFWKHVQHEEHASEDLEPFKVPYDPYGNTSKTARRGTPDRQPFTAEEVVALWRQARDKGDQPLADLIALGAYTGARIEELCSLKLANVSPSAFSIEEAKSAAGVRQVPIHAAIRGLVGRLKETSADGYLLSGLTFNKYDDRSNAIGKRFGRLKTAAGHGEVKVFHSIRKTVATLLENAHLPESIVADILGHEKQTITFGLYSGGASLQVKAEALAKLVYPFPSGIA